MIKLAAKEKHNRKRIVSMLEKTKNNYSKLKGTLDDLESQAAKINASLEKVRGSCGEARKNMLKFHKAIQNMDLSGATDAVFYDSGDVSYIIDSGEYALDVNNAGDPVKTKWRERAKKSKSDDNQAPYSSKLDDDDSEDGSDTSDMKFLDENSVDELYSSFMAEAVLEFGRSDLFAFGSNFEDEDEAESEGDEAEDIARQLAELQREIDSLG